MEEQEFFSYFEDEQELRNRIKGYGRGVSRNLVVIVRDQLKAEYSGMEDKVAEMKLYRDLMNTLAKLVADEMLKHADESGKYASEMFLAEHRGESYGN